MSGYLTHIRLLEDRIEATKIILTYVMPIHVPSPETSSFGQNVVHGQR